MPFAFHLNSPTITVVEGDLLDQDVDVIVNAWNRNIIPWWLLLPQGVSGAIKKRAGTAPFKELATRRLAKCYPEFDAGNGSDKGFVDVIDSLDEMGWPTMK